MSLLDYSITHEMCPLRTHHGRSAWVGLLVWTWMTTNWVLVVLVSHYIFVWYYQKFVGDQVVHSIINGEVKRG